MKYILRASCKSEGVEEVLNFEGYSSVEEVIKQFRKYYSSEYWTITEVELVTNR